MQKTEEHFKTMKRLEDERKSIEQRLEDETGYWVAIKLNELNGVYEFQTESYGAVKTIAELLNIKNHIQHTLRGVDDYPHEYSINDTYDGHKVKVFCIMTEKEYREEKRNHESI